MKKALSGLFVLVLTLSLSVQAQALDYKLDNSHSTIGFAVKHLGISTVRGFFNDYEGSFTLDPNDVKSFKADVTIQATSINTKHEGRDNHLRNSDFFDVEKFPTITFKGEALVKNDDGHQIAGVLTMKGVEKRIYLPVEISGPVDNPYGGKAIGLRGETTINRQDFGISWNKTLDNGGLAVSDDVTLVIELEGHAK